MGESDGLTFCLARPEDYDDMMAISQDIYGGNDYLPHRYHSWMNEPGRVVVIARRDRKLVRDTREKNLIDLMCFLILVLTSARSCEEILIVIFKLHDCCIYFSALS